MSVLDQTHRIAAYGCNGMEDCPVHTAPELCPGSGAWVEYGWSWYPCPDCGAPVYRGHLGLVEHRPGERGELPDRDAPMTQD